MVFIVFSFYYAFSTIFFMSHSESTRRKATLYLTQYSEYIISLPYNNIINLTQNIVIDDRGTSDSADDVNGTVKAVVSIKHDPNGSGEYKEILLSVTWNEIAPGSEGKNTNLVTQKIEITLWRYKDVQY